MCLGQTGRAPCCHMIIVLQIALVITWPVLKCRLWAKRPILTFLAKWRKLKITSVFEICRGISRTFNTQETRLLWLMKNRKRPFIVHRTLDQSRWKVDRVVAIRTICARYIDRIDLFKVSLFSLLHFFPKFRNNLYTLRFNNDQELKICWNFEKLLAV